MKRFSLSDIQLHFLIQLKYQNWDHHSKKKIFKIPVLILSETDHLNEFLIEIQNSYSCFEKGDTYLIQTDLLFETDETLWNKLL